MRGSDLRLRGATSFWFIAFVLGVAWFSMAGVRAQTGLVRYVALTGADGNPGTAQSPWRTLQHAADRVTPGTTVLVQPGTYFEKVQIRVSGSATGGYITFQADGPVVLSGAGVAGAHMIHLENRRYVRIVGFDIRDNTKVDTGSGIWIDGTGDHLELRNNRVHEIRGADAMGIAVYGRSALSPISDLVVEGNEIFDCDPAQSEALVLNGNVTRFRVANNLVHDVNNIGIDFIGGEGTCPDPEQDAARDGVCVGNRVWRARSSYGGGYGAGIYVDGGRNIVIEGNEVQQCDLGIEVGAENPGSITSGVIVRGNLIHRNDKVGLIFGGYEAAAGRVVDCEFLNNTCYKNDILADGNGEIAIQYAERNIIRNNIFFCGLQNVLLTSFTRSTGNVLDYNLWFAEVGADRAVFVWSGVTVRGLDTFRARSAQGQHSIFADPRLADADQGGFHLLPESPAIDAGSPGNAAVAGAMDFDGEPRVSHGLIDIGADEVLPLECVRFGDRQVRLSWPVSFASLVLEQTPSLSPSLWTEVAGQEVLQSGARMTLLRSADPGPLFYRLRTPGAPPF